MNNQTQPRATSPWMWIMNIGLLLVMAATAMPLLRTQGDAFRYIYTAGAVLCLIGRLMTPFNKNNPLRARRLERMQIWSGVFFCAGAFFMFYYDSSRMDWLAFTLAGAVIMVYTTLMIPRILKKEQ